MSDGRVDVVVLASWNADLICRSPRPLQRGETLMGHDFRIAPGGKGSNAAVACARQGAATAVIARVGDDSFGRMGLDLWRREGIDTRQVAVAAGEASGVAQILVYDDGDNSIAVASGANAGLDVAQVQAASAGLRSAKVLLANGETPMEATLEAFRIARAAGVFTLFNPAPARELPAELLALTDLLTPNESELRSLDGGADDLFLEQSAESLLQRHGLKQLVVTRGAAGCSLFRPGLPAWHCSGHAMPTLVDSIGAGDCFNGALAAALARGEALETALRWANAAAAWSVTGAGALGGLPDRAAVGALLGD
jgi:ribokinase